MVRLYKSTTGIVHLVLAGYICNQAVGKVQSNDNGTRDDITCKNCMQRFRLE